MVESMFSMCEVLSSNHDPQKRWKGGKEIMQAEADRQARESEKVTKLYSQMTNTSERVENSKLSVLYVIIHDMSFLLLNLFISKQNVKVTKRGCLSSGRS